MYVYVVTNSGGIYYESESTIVLGVFTTLEKAIDFVNKYLAERDSKACAKIEDFDTKYQYMTVDYDDPNCDWSNISIENFPVNSGYGIESD